MNRRDFTELLDREFEVIRSLNSTKGHDYSGDEDALLNFKEDSERLAKIVANDPVLGKWYVYFHKHLSAILTFLEEGDVKSEPIEGRIQDAVLYLLLLRGLIEEKKS